MANFEEQMRLFEAEVGQGPGRSRPPYMAGGGRGQVPPPPSFPPRQVPAQKQYSAPAVISKPSGDEDVFSTLMKYEKEVRQEKRDKKKGTTAGATPQPGPAKHAPEYKSSRTTIAAPPSKPSNMTPSALMKPSHISAQPTVTPVVKPGTQVSHTVTAYTLIISLMNNAFISLCNTFTYDGV